MNDDSRHRRRHDDRIFHVKQKHLFCNLLLGGKKYIDSKGNISVQGETSSATKIHVGGKAPQVGTRPNTP